MMEHFIFTRFSLRMKKAVDRSTDETWLRERVQILNQFLLPSLRGQTCRNFRWILMVSPSTPEWIRECSKDWAPAEVVEFESHERISAFLEREANTDRILCSRIDSDDAVAETYVEDLQKTETKAQEWLVFPNGVVWGNGRCCEFKEEPQNPFPTLVDVRPFVGPYCVQHNALLDFAPMRRVSDRPAWLIHVHQNNISNGPNLLNRGPELSTSKVTAIFHIDSKPEKRMKRVELINTLIERNRFQNYLEIGCAKNRTFNQVQAANKVGVDPISGGTVRKTSDEFFAQSKETFDVIFIDGLHHWEQVLRDVENGLAALSPKGVMILHDCLPTKEVHQLREPSPQSRAWTGDVWKAVVELRGWPHIDVAVLNSDWGLGVILNRPNTAPFTLDKKIEDLDWHWFQLNSQTALRVVDQLDSFCPL